MAAIDTTTEAKTKTCRELDIPFHNRCTNCRHGQSCIYPQGNGGNVMLKNGQWVQDQLDDILANLPDLVENAQVRNEIETLRDELEAAECP